MNSKLRTGLAATAGAALTVSTLWLTGVAMADPGTQTGSVDGPGYSQGYGVPGAPGAYQNPGQVGQPAPVPGGIGPDGQALPSPGGVGLDRHAPPAPGGVGPDGQVRPAPGGVGPDGQVPPVPGEPGPDGRLAPGPGAGPGGFAPAPHGAGLASHGPASAVPGSAQGAVTGYSTGKHGEVKGLYLSDGTLVKVPGHQGQQATAIAAIGDTVRADGLQHTTRHGESHLRADTLTDVGSGEAMTITHAGPKHGGPRG